MSKIVLTPTELLKDGWVKQHEVYPDQWWVKKYWDDTEGSHRDAIIRALEGLGSFASVLEVGCNAAPNLRRIHAHWPQVTLSGMDIHPGAIQYGRAAAKAEGWHFSSYVGDLRELGLLAEGTADVVLSCYALAYLDPRDIDGVLQAMIRIAGRAVILCEPMVLSGEEECYVPPGKGVVPEYHFAYQDRLARLYDTHRGIQLTPITPPHARLQHVLTLLK